MPSLRAFLAAARKALAVPPAQRASPLTFVTGNESADLDSLCSTLLLAYFRSNSAPHTLHIPLANLQREDLALRPELLAVLRPAELDAKDLLTLSELPDLQPDSTRWLLVDHNALTGELGRRFGDRVIGCIDHHADEGKVPHGIDVAPRVIATAGSCMSLVVEHCKDAWESQEDTSVDGELAHVALAPILIDTVNLESKDKTTAVDIRAAEFAEARLRATTLGPSYDRVAYWKELNRLKEDIDGMTFRNIMRKDYKEWVEGSLKLGMSTVVQGFDYLLDKADKEETDLLQEMRRWASEQKLDIMGVMTLSHPNGVFTRQLFVWGLTPQSVAAVKEFSNKNQDKLELKPWGDGALDADEDATWRKCWTNSQGCSRKQIAPMLREAMRDSSKL
ncbi:DHH phosphoesterase [Thozetella sp. PMI_491]|nr:DHH phosphoesterase [Thozetella sp. PMI_491]